VRKRVKSRREARKEEGRRRRDECDERSARLQPGDWIRFRCRESGSFFPAYEGKLARIKAWDDDGYNKSRAPRNKHVVVEVEPHLHDEPPTFRGKLQDFVPLTDMEVIAVAAL